MQAGDVLQRAKSSCVHRRRGIPGGGIVPEEALTDAQVSARQRAERPPRGRDACWRTPKSTTPAPGGWRKCLNSNGAG